MANINQLYSNVIFPDQSKHLKGQLGPYVSDEKCMGRRMSTFSSCVLNVSWYPK